MAAHGDGLITLDHLTTMATRVKQELDKKVGEVPTGYDSMKDYVDEVKDIAEIAEDSTTWHEIS